MKIYTYYDECPEAHLQPHHQKGLINLWKTSWLRQGYEPIVLNLEDAKRHSYFNAFNTEIRRIHEKITNKEIAAYGMSCWLRWLAYTTQEDEKFYVSDYDAINLNFPTTEPNAKLHFMDNDCPFLASGTPKQFENLCKTFVEVSNQRIEILKQQTNRYHDQEFFQYNLMPYFNESAEDLRNKHNILLTRNRREIGGRIDFETGKIFAGPNIECIESENYGVIHVSHENIQILQKKYRKYSEQDLNELRINGIKKTLKGV